MPTSIKLLALLLLLAACLIGSALSARADCPDAEVKCWGYSKDTQEHTVVCGVVRVPTWYDVSEMVCDPCPDGVSSCTMREACARAYPSCCSNGRKRCRVYWQGWQGSSCQCGPNEWSPPY